MANDLYKIELISRVGNSDITDITDITGGTGGTGMLYTNNSLVFVKLHPVKIKAAPKTDAVCVTRCGECKHWCNSGGTPGLVDVYLCKRLTNAPYSYIYRTKWDYCSYGERKEK